ncbi:hypothetical protein OH77DRAFT_665614 [Trametes cingulata]|nr:hypothetical protein OH77DRAFT_665614 [Trametes cingulata]
MLVSRSLTCAHLDGWLVLLIVPRFTLWGPARNPCPAFRKARQLTSCMELMRSSTTVPLREYTYLPCSLLLKDLCLCTIRHSE